MNRKGLKAAARQCIAEAKGPVIKVSLLYVIITALIMGIDIATTLLSDGTSASTHISDSLSLTVSTYVTVYGLSLVLQAVLVFLQAGYAVFTLRLSRNEEFDCGVLLSGVRDWLRVICFYILRAVYTGLWSLVYAIPMGLVMSPLAIPVAEGTLSEEVFMGIVVLVAIIPSVLVALRYWGGFYVLMDHPEMTSSEALAYTKVLCKHHRWELFKLEVSLLPTMLLCVITVGILLIWKLPYIEATHVHAYHQLNIFYEQRLNAYRSRFQTPEY